jgi:spiro-SPASM protein
MVRMNENETELEAFYRFWKEKIGQVIIQKHDSFCRTIPDRRVADLSPLVRHPCWHLKRDMCILSDGTVPFCREDLYASRSCGNAFTDEFAAIWDANRTLYEQHVRGVHEGMCGACDEYYTYNF